MKVFIAEYRLRWSGGMALVVAPSARRAERVLREFMPHAAGDFTPCVVVEGLTWKGRISHVLKCCIYTE